MRVVCIHIPRGGSTDAASAAADAVYATKCEAVPSLNFWHQLDDLAESIWEPFSLEYYSSSNIVYVCMAGSDSVLDYLTTGIYTWMGSAEIRDVEDYTLNVTPNTVTVGMDLKMWRPDIYPLSNWRKLKFASVGPTLTALSLLPEGDRVLVQVIVNPLHDSASLHLKLALARSEERFMNKLRPRNWFRRGLPNETWDLIKRKCVSHLFHINYRVSAFAEAPTNSGTKTADSIAQRLAQHVTAVADATRNFNTVDQNRFVLGKMERGKMFLQKVQDRKFIKPFRLSTEELSTIWVPPGVGWIPNTAQVLSRKAPPPVGLPTNAEDNQISFFGHTNYRDTVIPFGVRRFDRRRHMYVVGKSGGGKSCLLQLLVRNDIEQGFGCAVLDPHGDLVDEILKLVPKHRANDVVIFDPSDSAFPPSFNPIHAVRPELRTRVTMSFVDAFRRVFGSDWSERMDHVLRYAMLGLVNLPGANILSLRRMLADDSFRAEVVRQASDESVKRFWLREFSARRQDFEEGPISRLLNRLDELLATETMKNIFGQSKNLFDFREFMDSRKIVLLKISKGVLGTENAELLGTLLIWKIYEAAMSRADIPAEDRQDFYFYIDELQNFATESFGEILSESRKYRLCLTFANQYLGQLSAPIRKTIFGNVNNFLSFRVGAEDAGLVASELAPRFGTEDVVNLALREFYAKMSIDGEVQESFSGRTLDVRYLPENELSVAQCLENSRSRYCLPVSQAREQVSRGVATNGRRASNT
jgi:hypothetical protein